MPDVTEEQDNLGISFGTGTLHLIDREAAFQLAHDLLSKLDETRSDESDEHFWYLFAGTKPAVLIKEEINTLDTLKANARILARIHKAVIWAICLGGGPTGILAWPHPSGVDKLSVQEK